MKSTGQADKSPCLAGRLGRRIDAEHRSRINAFVVLSFHKPKLAKTPDYFLPKRPHKRLSLHAIRESGFVQIGFKYVQGQLI